MTKGQAVARIAESLIGHLNASDLEEIAGVAASNLTTADTKRLADAVDTVIDRLLPLTRRK